MFSYLQNNKYQRILEELNQQGRDILEIGCGWAGFIKQASKKGFNIKGLTLSSEQKNIAKKLLLKKSLMQKLPSRLPFRKWQI